MKELIPKGLIQHGAAAWKSGKCCSANPAVFVPSCSTELGTCSKGQGKPTAPTGRWCVVMAL